MLVCAYVGMCVCIGVSWLKLLIYVIKNTKYTIIITNIWVHCFWHAFIFAIHFLGLVYIVHVFIQLYSAEHSQRNQINEQCHTNKCTIQCTELHYINRLQ